MGILSRLFSNGSTRPACNLFIGTSPARMIPVDDPTGLGGYSLAIDKLIREEAPDVVYCHSGDPADLSMVRKSLEYLAMIGSEVGVAEQLPDEEVAAIFGVDVRTYQGTVIDPQGNAASYGR
ncbi:hypothetical protein HFU84_06975 [Acidithiobacillus sp. CV18-2]|nr:hypothetical protein [Acidithiobacillus sp. CV18-3]MBU2756003.1 hypothetical protein [Acidithiobacillus sp. BN09-2]MBU2777248.1 hypothetical protein [Acidithiobacillus sp. CV18-2]MBU2799902.1 hypothetical protein [Acidithiobacillus sp. VAN18-4]